MPITPPPILARPLHFWVSLRGPWPVFLLCFMVLHSQSLATRSFFFSFYQNVYRIKIVIYTPNFTFNHVFPCYRHCLPSLTIICFMILFFHLTYWIIRYFLSYCFIHSIFPSAESTSHFGHLVILCRHHSQSSLISF